MEMMEEDRPPEHIWLNEEELADHFRRVKERHRSGSSGADTEPVPDVQNELTRGLRNG